MSMKDIPSFSESANLARVAAGWKGGPFYMKPITPPAMNFTEGYPSEVLEKLQDHSIPQPTPTDTWFSRNTMRK